jgi:hypothetical protein
MIPGIVHKFADLILGHSNLVFVCNLTEIFACVSPADYLNDDLSWYIALQQIGTSHLEHLGLCNYFRIYKDLV